MQSMACSDGEADVKKGPWTPEEDKLLVDYIGAHGHGSWHRLPRLAGLNRSGKSCRERWTNHLRPDIKHVRFTDDEEKLLISLHSTLGNKWSEITTHMPGRTDNEIKNYWFTHLRKKLPDPQHPLIDGLRDIYRHSLVEASSSLPTSVGPENPPPQSWTNPDQFLDISTMASFDFGAGDTHTDGLRNFYRHAIVESCLPNSFGPSSSSSIQADPAQLLDFSTSFDFDPGSSSSVPADPARFLDFSTSFDFGSAGLDCSTYFDFDSGDTHTDLLSDVNPHGLLEGLDNFYFDPYPGAGSSSLSIKADPAQPPSSSSTTSGIVLDELPFFDDSVSSSSGAMRPLVGKLGMLLEGSVSISKRVKNGVCLLKDDVEEIGSYLDELSGLEDAPPMAKCWMNEVRDLSYDIEDYIDSTLFRQPDHLNKNKKKKNKKFTSNVKIPKIRLKCCNCKQTKSKYVKTIWVCRNIRHIIINNRLSKRPRNIGAPEMISDFRKYLQEAIERHDRYKLHCCSTLRRRFLSTGRMLPTPFEEASQIVIDGRTNEFINSLTSNAAYQQQLNVVSVLGSGCLGKTTLAYVLYNRIGMQFDCRAFIRVPKNPDMKRLFRDLFSQLHHKKQPLPTSCNELGISDNIRNYLQDKRYLIIIDDLCDASVWDIIKYAFPKGNRGSRIITTTQIEDVALTCCCDNSEHVFEMKPLDDDHSRKLFFGRLFGKESGCPEEFKQVSDEIVDMCGGLPLAIINIASHIANQQKAVSMDLLIYIRDSLRSDLWSNSTSERTRQVLNLSYNNLPDCLKTCLLYFGMYPEGSIISKDDLLKQWVAEGFTARERKEHDQDMMENAAGNYFRELIDRSFIQPIYTDYNNKVLSCMVHDMVHDLIIQKSAEENFIVLVDYNRKNIALSHKVRRLSLHFGEARYAKTPANIRKSQVRSLGFFGLLECMPCIREFKVLHVLNLQLSGHPGDHDLLDLTGISELLQLRYLKIAGDVCIQLPNRIRGLQCLETLDIMGATRLTAVPWDIIHLPHLLHLTLPVDTKLLSWIGSMSDSIVSLWSLGKLKYLQDLHLTNSSTHLSYYLERSMEALCSLFEGHGNLKTIVVAHGSLAKNIVYGDSNVIIPWDHMAPPPLLQRFECSPDSCIIFFRIPPWVRNLHSLSILKIAVMGLHLSCLDILGSLPALTALSLYLRRAPTYKISFDNAGFSALKYFKLRIRSGIAWLKFGADAMPDLWKLKLVFNDIPEMDYQRGTPVISIEHMRGLREISAKFGVAASDLEYASRNIISNHPNNPRINMQLVAYSSNVDGSTKQTQQPDDIMEEPDEYIRQEIGERPSDKRISKSGGSSSHVHIPEIRPILGVERWEHIFDKVLTLGDVGKLNRLMIPKKHAEKYFPLEALSAEVGIILSFEDCDGKPWRFRYSYWDSCQSYVMTKGWSRFVEEKRLSTGDIVSFFRGVAGGAVGRLFIDWRSEQRQEYMF